MWIRHAINRHFLAVLSHPKSSFSELIRSPLILREVKRKREKSVKNSIAPLIEVSRRLKKEFVTAFLKEGVQSFGEEDQEQV